MDFYHVLNRGVEKRTIVLNDSDRQRFVRSLYVMNDVKPPPNGKTQQKIWSDLGRKRTPIVHIHAWCLMDNHYHLLLSPTNNDLTNISKFMKKLNMGYAKFFNEKYNRSGYLWQGRYKKIQILNDAHFLYIPYYIHLNPLDYVTRDWRVGKIADPSIAHSFLKQYRWSSFLDYNNEKNFPSIIDKEILENELGKIDMQKQQIKSIISSLACTDLSHKLET